MRHTKIILALCAVLAPAALTIGCGGVPDSAVATVDGESIDRQQYDRWLANATKAGQGADKSALRKQVLQQLISYRWLEAEASERGITVADADVRKTFDQQRKASFPKDADYRKFLTSSGQTEQDLLLRVRAEMLSNKLRDQVTKGLAPVTNKQIADYYEKNKPRFADPERRDLRVVLTTRKADAERARAALEGGASWSSVAREHSVDRASRSKGGRMAGIVSGQQGDDFDKAVFGADRGELTGPVKTQVGHYVFEVTKVTPGRQQNLQQATPAIKSLLAAETQQKAIDAFLDDFRTKWKSKTECGDDYRTKDCSNAPTAR
jgi:parvulin-like peptidyl-prolyl isomerase